MEKKRTYGVWAVRSSTSIFGPAQSWCKENGKPLEFDTKAAAENYAKEANEHTTANVRYYVKEKEPEPGAVRKGTSQPELDARSHEEVTPRNDAAEKQNEIPGRQIPSQTDPLVEIRSAVHSNYAGMVAMLGADNRVYLGREERCHYQNMQPSYYDNQDGSLCFVCDQPDMYYFLYGEGWAHTQAEMLERSIPCVSMKNLRDCKMASLHSLPSKEKFCLPDSRFRRRKVIFAMRNFMRKDKPGTTICWMAG